MLYNRSHYEQKKHVRQCLLDHTVQTISSQTYERSDLKKSKNVKHNEDPSR